MVRVSLPAPRRAVSLAATKVASHVHIAYSSHMWPRYPAFASTTARSRRIRGAADQENGGDAAVYGPSLGTSSTRPAPSAADAAATTSTERHASAGTSQRTRCGAAEPSVRAPTRIPIAHPRPSRNQPAAIFIPGGYTPASAAPVATRNANPLTGPRDIATPSVASAAVRLAAAARRRADQRSLSVSMALTSAPPTKPSCTEMVSHEAPVGPRRHAAERAGATAEALNHGAMAHSCATARTARTRRGVRGPLGDRGTPRESRTWW